MQAPSLAYLWIRILTATTYLFARHAREQVCIYMCPWLRIQTALTEEWALNDSYRRDRGEPRMSVKTTVLARTHGDVAGDCVPPLSSTVPSWLFVRLACADTDGALFDE